MLNAYLTTKNYKIVLKVALFCSAIYFPLFLHLDHLPLRVWDESRVAFSALEMHLNGNYLIPTINGEPDMWSTKPPLMLWFQVLFIKIIGISELAIRLPSAFAAVLTCTVLLLFCIKYLKSYWLGFIASLVLVTANGYVGLHTARTGDYDSLLTLLLFTSTISYFLYIEWGNNRYLLFTFICLSLAVLTKGVAGMLLVPALVIYTVIRKQVVSLLKNKMFYIGLFIFLFVAIGYYFLREQFNPGYLKAVQQNELGGRYLKTLENHNHPFFFYYESIINHEFTYWYLLIPCGICCGLFMKNSNLKKTAQLLLIAIITFFLIISSAKTKLTWYALPLYPFMALSCAIFIFTVYKFLAENASIQKHFHKNVFSYTFLFLIFVTPYRKIIDNVYFPKEYDWAREQYGISYRLRKDLQKNASIPEPYFICTAMEHSSDLDFYITWLKKSKGITVKIKAWDQLEASDIVLVSEHELKQNIERKYTTNVLEDENYITKYLILGKK